MRSTLGACLDVELQHVAVWVWVHGRPPFVAFGMGQMNGTSGWVRTTGLDLRRVALFQLSYGRMDGLVAPDDFETSTFAL